MNRPKLNDLFVSFFIDDSLTKETYQECLVQTEIHKSFNLGLFMMKWSNKFVFISLLVISAIALTKQAWI